VKCVGLVVVYLRVGCLVRVVLVRGVVEVARSGDDSSDVGCCIFVVKIRVDLEAATMVFIFGLWYSGQGQIMREILRTMRAVAAGRCECISNGQSNVAGFVQYLKAVVGGLFPKVGARALLQPQGDDGIGVQFTYSICIKHGLSAVKSEQQVKHTCKAKGRMSVATAAVLRNRIGDILERA
jgi:hypothetical protein